MQSYEFWHDTFLAQLPITFGEPICNFSYSPHHPIRKVLAPQAFPMTGQPPNQTPAWSGGGLPPGIKKPPAKRPRPPTRRPLDPYSNPKFIPPKDLAKHLAITNPIPKNPLNLPKSTVKFGVRVNYGRLTPYYDQEVGKSIQPIIGAAGYIALKPFKGYIDIGFTSPEAADTAANIPIYYKETPLPTTQTQNAAESTLCIRFVNLPTHLPYDTLYHELMEGLSNYGSNPVIRFDIPHGFSNLASPTASANVLINQGFNISTIPPITNLKSAPESSFRVLFGGSQMVCPICGLIGKNRGHCQKAQTPEKLLSNDIISPTWGSTIPAIPKRGALNPRLTSNNAPTNSNTEGLVGANQQTYNASNIYDHSSNMEYRELTHGNNQNSTNSDQTTPLGGKVLSCDLPPVQYTTGNPFEILEYIHNNELVAVSSYKHLGPHHWFEENQIIKDTEFRCKNQFTEYLNSHSIASRIKLKNLPTQQLDAYVTYKDNIKKNIPRLLIPAHTPPELNSALVDATNYAKESLLELVEVTEEAIASRSDSLQHRSTTKLANTRINANLALATLANTLYAYDSLSNGSTVMAYVTPHLADMPTPWLSAFERLPSELTFEPDPPAEPDPMS